MDHVLFGGSSTLALIMTNFDNLAVLLVLMVGVSTTTALTGYALSQGVILALAFILAEGAAEALDGRAGILGIVPLSLGLWALWRQWQNKSTSGSPGLNLANNRSVFAIAALFIPFSMDSLALFSTLFADSAPSYRIIALIGAAAGVGAIVAAALVLSRAASGTGFAARMDRLGPWAMIAAGLYILSNSATDIV